VDDDGIAPLDRSLFELFLIRLEQALLKGSNPACFGWDDDDGNSYLDESSNLFSSPIVAFDDDDSAVVFPPPGFPRNLITVGARILSDDDLTEISFGVGSVGLDLSNLSTCQPFASECAAAPGCCLYMGQAFLAGCTSELCLLKRFRRAEDMSKSNFELLQGLMQCAWKAMSPQKVSSTHPAFMIKPFEQLVCIAILDGAAGRTKPGAVT
jgi:hypothetical protein